MSTSESPGLKERILAAERDGCLRDLLSSRVDAVDGAWSVVADVTDGCRQGCLTCTARAPRVAQEVGVTEALGEVLLPHAEFLAVGCLGEPLLHPDLPEIFRTLSRIKTGSGSGAFLCLLTAATVNGALEPLSGTGLEVLLVSADSTNPGAYARVRGGAHWTDTRAGLEAAGPALADGGVRLGAQSLLLRCTVRHARQTVVDLARLGVTSVTFTQPTQVPPRAKEEVLRQGDDVFSEVTDLEAWIAAGAGVPTIQLSLPRRPPELHGALRARLGDGATWDEDRASGPAVCVAPWFNLRVDSLGEVFPCNFMDDPGDALGNLREVGFEGLVCGAKARRIREVLLGGGAPTAACARCAFGPGAQG